MSNANLLIQPFMSVAHVPTFKELAWRLGTYHWYCSNLPLSIWKTTVHFLVSEISPFSDSTCSTGLALTRTFCYVHTKNCKYICILCTLHTTHNQSIIHNQILTFVFSAITATSNHFWALSAIIFTTISHAFCGSMPSRISCTIWKLGQNCIIFSPSPDAVQFNTKIVYHICTYMYNYLFTHC